MENNCLVRTLKSQVSNNLLLGIGDILINVSEQDINAGLEVDFIDTNVTSADILSANGTVLGTVAVDGNKKMIFTLSSLPSGTSYIMLHNKYKITRVLKNGTISSLANNFKLNLSDLSFSKNLYYVDTPPFVVFKDGAKILDLPKDSPLYIFYVGSEHISGKIEDFLMYPVLRSINIRNTTGIIIGELKNFAEKAYNKFHSGSDIPTFDYKYKLEMKAPTFTFNGTSYDTANWVETKVLSDKVTVTIDGNLVGTYNGSTWTYA